MQKKLVYTDARREVLANTYVIRYLHGEEQGRTGCIVVFHYLIISIF